MGSKSDLLDGPSPLHEQAEQLARREDMIYCEVSAKTGAGVGKLFAEVVRRLVEGTPPSAEEVETERVVV